MTANPWQWLVDAEGVPSALAAARDGIDAVLRDRGLRQTSAEQTAEALLRGATASAALSGSTATLDHVRAGTGDALTAAAVRVATQLLSLAPRWRTAPVQVLARLHTIAAAGQVPDEALGRPAGAEAADRLQWLGRVLATSDSAPALGVAAIVHAEVAAGALFGSCDGLVARAAERLVLAARGVDPTSVTVPEVGHLAVGVDAYAEELAAYRDGGEGGVRRWLMHCATAYAAGAAASPVS